MKAFVRGSTDLEAASVVEHPQTAPGPDDVVVRVSHCGLCGSDLRIHYTDSTSFTAPLVQGHEYSGTVVAVGTNVDKELVGAGVVAVSIQECGECDECRAGHTNVCSHRGIPGWSYDGGLAEYSVLPAGGIKLVPEGMSLSLAALVEPMAVGVHAAAMADHLAPSRAVISGPGPIGIFTGLALKHQGWDVMVTGIAHDSERRLPTAASMGLATAVIDSETGDVELGDFTSPALWVEASGSPAGLQLGTAKVQPEGLITVVGIPHGPEEYDLRIGMRKGVTLRFSYAYHRPDYDRAFQVLAAGLVNEERLLDVYDLDDTLKALDDAKHGRIMKPMIRVSP
ncbi:MAG: Alcohol dehydrogenase GroES-like protein [Marmoricola sp.]|nr:Alcohol dehydrogenase GroES-like protein [Marmoricola sp.]